VYCKPVWFALEELEVELLLVNSRNMRMVPGRKTDVADAAWIAQLLEVGLLRGNFVPPPVLREQRDLTRYRKRLVQDRTREGQRVEKVFEDAGSNWPRWRSRRWEVRTGDDRWCWRSWLGSGCGPISPSCNGSSSAGSGASRDDAAVASRPHRSPRHARGGARRSDRGQARPFR
jgi:Transposase